jgi:putative protease
MKLKVLAPFSAVEEVEPLIAAGAEELYCGFVPAVWVRDQPADQWINRRYPRGANLCALSQLAESVRLAARWQVPVFLTVNAHCYSPAQLPTLMKMAELAAEAGVQALIVSDLSLLLALRDAALPIRRHLSSLGHCTNAEAASFFAELGVERLILPRGLSTREIAALRGRGPRPLEYEVFLLNDGCAYDEALCLTSHHYGPICLTPWKVDPHPMGGAKEGRTSKWAENWHAYQRYLWCLNNCGSSCGASGLPNGPCGLCALSALGAIGIDAVKIVGREASTPRKLASVRVARAVVERVRLGESAEAVSGYARELRGTPELCESTYTCYYR